MLNIVLLGECKHLFKPLSEYLLETPSIEAKINNYLHVLSNESTRCIYTDGYVDSRLIDYIRIARLIIIAHSLPECITAYWVELVRQHTQTTPILLVGIQSDTFFYPIQDNPYHITHLYIRGLQDPSLRDYIKERYNTLAEENIYCCCWKF